MSTPKHKILGLLHFAAGCRGAKSLNNNDSSIFPTSGKGDYVKLPCYTVGKAAASSERDGGDAPAVLVAGPGRDAHRLADIALAGSPREIPAEGRIPAVIPATPVASSNLLSVAPGRAEVARPHSFPTGGAWANAPRLNYPVRLSFGTGPIFETCLDVQGGIAALPAVARNDEQNPGAGVSIRPASKAGDFTAPARRNQTTRDGAEDATPKSKASREYAGASHARTTALRPGTALASKHFLLCHSKNLVLLQQFSENCAM